MNDGDYNLKAIRKNFRQNGVFYTPLELANKLAKYLPSDIDEVYDPTCGRGGLFAPFINKGIKLYGQDIDHESIAECQRLYPDGKFAVGDVLTNPAFTGKKFRAIVANPPFSVKWVKANDPRWQNCPALAPNSRADWMFMLHALSYLSDDGVLAAIVSNGSLYRGQSELKIRQYIASLNIVDHIESVPAGKFVDTNIPVTILVMKKSRQIDDPVTMVNGENGDKRTVSVDELVKANSWLELIPAIEIDEPKVDPIELNRKAEDAEVRSLERAVGFAAAIRLVDSKLPPINEFLDRLQGVLNKARQKNDAAYNAADRFN